MFVPLIYPHIKLILGTLYPSYKTWKALKLKDPSNRMFWLRYWVNFGAFQVFELLADISLAFIVPLYVHLKIIILIWLVSGTRLFYYAIVNRSLVRHEKTIDRYIKKIVKIREEIVALIWTEVSQCSVNIMSSLLAGGLSVVAKSPEIDGNPAIEPAEPEELAKPRRAIETEPMDIETVDID